MTRNTMQRLIIVSVVLAGGLMILAILAAVAMGPGPYTRVQDAVDAYARYQFDTSHTVIQVELMARATHPEVFTKTMSHISYGDRALFQTQVNYRITDPSYAGSGKPAPFPPADLWCVRLNRSSVEAVPHYVFVALHSDLYNSDWLLHEPPDDPKIARQIVDKVGCSP